MQTAGDGMAGDKTAGDGLMDRCIAHSQSAAVELQWSSTALAPWRRGLQLVHRGALQEEPVRGALLEEPVAERCRRNRSAEDCRRNRSARRAGSVTMAEPAVMMNAS